MITVQRGTARGDGVIESDVGNVWALLTDWGNMDWWGNEVDQVNMRAARTYLEGEKDKVPRTKVIERYDGHTNREVLIHEDQAVYRLYYTGSDGLLPGVRNYIATWTLDIVESGRCRMTISSNFDVVEPGSVESTSSTLEAVYQMIFKGLNGYLAERDGVYDPAN